MYAKHILAFCVLLAVVNAVVTQQVQVRHRFNFCLVLQGTIVSDQTLLITGCIL